MADARLLSISTPLGPLAFVPTRLRVVDRIGAPYTIEVDLASEQVELLPSKLLTQPISVEIKQPHTEAAPLERCFHGLVAGFERLGPVAGGLMGYRLHVVPGIWRLGLRTHCRIFQEQTVKEIVQSVLAEHEQPAPAWGMLPQLEPIPYCTQFNETDLAFVSRLLEEHGLAWYHSHSADAHTLHISSLASGFPNFSGGDVRVLHGSGMAEDFSRWDRCSRARPSAVDLVDMDGERSQPSITLSRQCENLVYEGEPAMWAGGKVHRWPGGMSTRPGVDSAKLAMQAFETGAEHYTAATLDPRFDAGLSVSVAVSLESGDVRTATFVVTEIEHSAQDESGLIAGSHAAPSYAAQLRLVDGSRAYVPPTRHSRPAMAGLYSATVTGPSGAQIHVDEFGRIKVKFRWDRSGATDDSSSCWLRVAQAAAGSWGGTWFLPRVGDEVLVAFLDGDPDRPVVTGSVYGKDAKPPFEPGTNPAQSGIRTRSHKSQSADDANELRFEDKKGKEEVFLHAQKDLKVEVENDEVRTVDHDQTVTVKNSRTVTVKDADDTLTVEKGDRTTTVKTGNDALVVEKGDTSRVVQMGNASQTIKMGNLTVKCDLGKVLIEAMQSITLKVGQSTVVVDQTGVTVKGMLISHEAQMLHKTKGLMTEQKGTAMVQVQGGIVMIN